MRPWLIWSGATGAEAVAVVRAGRLLGEASAAGDIDPDRLRLRARQVRDEFDTAGIAIREEERRAARSARLIETPDGGGRLIWTMDPETLALVKEVCDRATSPRRGAPGS